MPLLPIDINLSYDSVSGLIYSNEAGAFLSREQSNAILSTNPIVFDAQSSGTSIPPGATPAKGTFAYRYEEFVNRSAGTNRSPDAFIIDTGNQGSQTGGGTPAGSTPLPSLPTSPGTSVSPNTGVVARTPSSPSAPALPNQPGTSPAFPSSPLSPTPLTPLPPPPSLIPPPTAVINTPVVGQGNTYTIEYERVTNGDCEIWETVYLVTYQSNGTKLNRQVHPIGPNPYNGLSLAQNPRLIGYDPNCLAGKANTPPPIPGGATPPATGGPIPPTSGGTVPPPVVGGSTPRPSATGIIYHPFNEASDIISNRVHVTTHGAWSDSVGSLYGFYLNSSQPSDQTDYYYDIYQSQSSACGSSIQFSVAYGHRLGSGSVGTSGNLSISPSKAVYSQHRLLCLEPSDTTFTFSSGSTSVDSDHIYVISVGRSRLNDKIDPGNWQLTLSELNGTTTPAVNTGSAKTITLIDDSIDSDDRFTIQNLTSPVYNIVSGSISGGVYDENDGTYGLVYPDLGLIVLNGNKLDEQLAFATATSSNTDGDNARRLFLSISGSASTNVSRSLVHPFIMRNGKNVTTTYFFANISPHEYNFSNNPTWVTGSHGEFLHKSFEKDPKAYITTIGLYNDKYELLAIGKLSQPFKKDYFKGTHITVKLNY